MIATLCAAAGVLIAALPWLLGIRRPARRPRPAEATAQPSPVPVGDRVAQAWRSHRRPNTPGTEPVRRIRRSTQAATVGWAEVLDALARSTSTGSSLSAAIDAAGSAPGAPTTLARIGRELRTGRALRAAIDAATPVGSDETLALAVLGALAGSGGPPGAALDRAAAVLRERRTIDAERDVAAAQATISARVLVVLPLLIMVWSIAADERAAELLLTTPFGLGCLGGGTVLDLAGWRWMRRIVRSR